MTQLGDYFQFKHNQIFRRRWKEILYSAEILQEYLQLKLLYIRRVRPYLTPLRRKVEKILFLSSHLKYR